jgi:hypothetical protein
MRVVRLQSWDATFADSWLAPRLNSFGPEVPF